MGVIIIFCAVFLSPAAAVDSQLTVMSTVWMSVAMSLAALHSYVPALCLDMDGISRYSSSEARSPVEGHRQKESEWRQLFA